jgi:hypothetical protein
MQGQDTENCEKCQVQLSMLPPRHSPSIGLQPLLKKLSIIATFIFSLLPMFQIKFQILNVECQVLSAETIKHQVLSVKFWILNIEC